MTVQPSVLRDALGGFLRRKRHFPNDSPESSTSSLVSAEPSDDDVSLRVGGGSDLNGARRSSDRDERPSTDEADEAAKQRNAGVHARNQLLVVLGMACLTVPFFGLQALESSINDVGGVGSACLALSYGPSLFSVTFLSPFLLRRLGVQRTVQLSSIPFVGFVAAHFKVVPAPYLSMCTLFGIFNMMLGTSITVLSTSNAIDYASIYGVAPDLMVAKFSSLLYLGINVGYFIGPLASSVILHNSQQFVLAAARNATICPGTGEKAVVDEQDRTILLGVYLGLAVFANLVMCGFRPASNTSIKARLANASALQQITATIRIVGDFDLLMLIPAFFGCGLTKQLIQVDFTKFFITPCLGVASVGFSIACFATANFVTTTVLPRLLRHIRRTILIALATAMQVAVLLVLVLWKKSRNAALLYALATVWGMADACWNILICVMIGILFRDRQEASISNFRVWQGMGVALSSLYSQRIGDCVKHMRIKFVYVGLYQILALATFLILEYRVRQMRKREESSGANQPSEAGDLELEPLRPDDTNI